jgi:thymidylate synthase
MYVNTTENLCGGKIAMTKLIQAQNLSLAWLAGIEHLVKCGGKDINVIIEIEQVGKEDSRIRQLLDDFLAERSTHKEVELFPVTTVANTLFPQALYHPQRGNDARSFLYWMHEQSFAITKRYQANCHGTYFQRMVAWPGKHKNINQLEMIIHRLQKGLRRSNPLSSAYEIGVSEVEDGELDTAQTEEIRIYQPGSDGRIMGFPCLSHISLTLSKSQLHLTALYRNQHFIRKAYGNYLGLSRLLLFLCQEIGCKSGRIACVASHADAELGLGKHAIIALVEQCRSALSVKQAVM